MAINKEFIRGSGYVGIIFGVGLFLGAGYTGSQAYQEVSNCDRETIDRETIECSQDTIDAYQRSGDAATVPFWTGLGITALSGIAIKIGDRN